MKNVIAIVENTIPCGPKIFIEIAVAIEEAIMLIKYCAY